MSRPTCYNCGKPATAIIQDTSEGRILLTMLLCDECNARRKRIEENPTFSDEERAFMARITAQNRRTAK